MSSAFTFPTLDMLSCWITGIPFGTNAVLSNLNHNGMVILNVDHLFSNIGDDNYTR